MKRKPMDVDAINQVADGREQWKQVTFDCSTPFFFDGRKSERVRQVQASNKTVRPPHDERCERQFVCDSTLSAKSDVNDIELNGETDDEDVEDGETRFDDGSAAVRNIRDPGQPTESEDREHMTTHRPYRSWCKFCATGCGVNSPHRRSDAQDDLQGVIHVSMDYGFLGEKESEEQLTPVLMLVPRKGN